MPAARKSRTPSEPASRRYVPGVISIHELYRLDEALARLSWTSSAYRAARRRGLQTLTSGKRVYLAGEEIRRFLLAEGGSAAATSRRRVA